MIIVCTERHFLGQQCLNTVSVFLNKLNVFSTGEYICIYSIFSTI